MGNQRSFSVKDMRAVTDSKKRLTGTREWSQHSFNCVKGCGHGCLYCYARAGRFNSKRGAEWTQEELSFPKVTRKNGVVMYPTQHDFTAATADHCLMYLEKLLGVGNNVLVVTKSGLVTVCKIMDVLRAFPREQSEIRFTLSHLSPSVGNFWEPGAPIAEDRINALSFAKSQGFRTSVSCEPWLDDLASLVELVKAVSPLVTETIWIGHANKLRERLRWAWMRGTPFDADHRADLDRAMTIIEAQQTSAGAGAVYKALKDNPKVRWKDSYQQMLNIDSEGVASHA
jgi:hypothetical protein